VGGGAVPTFFDNFASDDPARWITFDGHNWPPPVGAPGKWSRCFYYGWPSNAGSQDPAARTLAANKEAQSYEDRAVTIGLDGLVLTAARDANNHSGLPWTSGCIVQSRDAAMLFGYFEMTAKLPKGRGLWPAFWLLSSDMTWPPEIDVLEKVGKDQADVPTDDVFRSGVVQAAGNWLRSTGLDSWHRYGVLWTADTISFVFDGRMTASQPTPANCRRPMYMLINLAIGGPGSWPGEPAADVTTASMTVRSVASYALGSWGAALLPT
jgi:beta-glucanase (GH16 family)